MIPIEQALEKPKIFKTALWGLFMSRRRYSKELKLEAVQAYLNGEGSYEVLRKRFGSLSAKHYIGMKFFDKAERLPGEKNSSPPESRGDEITM